MAGHHRGQRAEHQAIGEQRRRGHGRRAVSERFADAAVQAAADEQGAGFEIRGAHGDGQQHDRQHRPRVGGTEAGGGHARDEERRAAELGEGARRRAPHRDVRHQRPRREDDADTFRRGKEGDSSLSGRSILSTNEAHAV